MPFCISMAQRTESTTLLNSMRTRNSHRVLRYGCLHFSGILRCGWRHRVLSSVGRRRQKADCCGRYDLFQHALLLVLFSFGHRFWSISQIFMRRPLRTERATELKVPCGGQSGSLVGEEQGTWLLAIAARGPFRGPSDHPRGRGFKSQNAPGLCQAAQAAFERTAPRPWHGFSMGGAVRILRRCCKCRPESVTASSQPSEGKFCHDADVCMVLTMAPLSHNV